MDTTTPAMQALARRLIALESARERPDGPDEAAGRACERLRPPLAKLMGPAGFGALLSRATALATRGAPPPGPDRTLQDASAAGPGEAGRDPQIGAAVLTNLLGLLAAFIGEPLTLSLVRDAWPDAMESESGPKTGERS